MHKGSTYHIVKLFLNRLTDDSDKIDEFFLPRAMDQNCCGCFSCFLNGENTCPHFDKVHPIAESLEKADLIILSSPVYVFSISGQLKSLLDHFGYQWMPHRPNKTMFSKVGLVISTAAGAGMKKANQNMKDNLFYWGVPKIYSYGKAVEAIGWENISHEKKNIIEREVNNLSRKIKKSVGRARPTLKTKILFSIMGLMQKKSKWNPTDRDYWEKNGWLTGGRPW